VIDTAKGLPFAGIAVYLRLTMPGNERQPRGFPSPLDLLEFHPWMLALAVFLACAIGITVMEQFRDDPQMWAQASSHDGGGPARE